MDIFLVILSVICLLTGTARAAGFVKRHPVGCLLALACVLVIVLLQSCSSSLVMLGNSSAGAAVSYTHLDVYKRQVQKSPELPEGLFLMDGIEGLRSLPRHSVDMLLTDPPDGTTRNFWDVPLPLPELWEAVKWAVKPDGAVLFLSLIHI